MILVVGRPGLDEQDRLDLPAGLVAAAAARSGARVELVGSVGDDASGELVALALGQAGIGHAALLRDPAGATPHMGGPGGPLPRLEAEDLELGLSYLAECRVLVIADSLDERGFNVARAGAEYHDAQLIVLVAAGQRPSTDLPPASIVLERPAGDDTAFADLVGRYAARLAAGEQPAAAWQAAVREVGWEPARPADEDGSGE